MSVCLPVCLSGNVCLCFYPSICLNMRMYSFISMSVYTGACMSLSSGFYPAVSLYMCMYVSISLSVCKNAVFLSVCMHMQTRVSISFLPLCTCACMHKAAFNAHFDISTQRSISSSESSSYICLCENARFSRICACSPEPSLLENATNIKKSHHIVQSRKSLHFSRGKCYIIFLALISVQSGARFLMVIL